MNVHMLEIDMLLMITMTLIGYQSDIYLSRSRARFSRLSLDRVRFGGSSVSLRLN